MGSYRGGRVSLRICALALAVGVLPACATTTDFGFLMGHGSRLVQLDWFEVRAARAGLSGSGGYVKRIQRSLVGCGSR